MTDFGVYVHVPFCRHRCDYCAFATFTDRDHLMVRYVEAVRAEVRREIETGMKSADTVFFGGGTPSRLAPELLMSILDVIPRTSGAEVTVECNPDDVSLEMFRVFADRGVNRISFGVQSMQGHVLASLGRTHDPENVRRGVDAARGIGLSFNLDVIYGAHGETVEDWERTVRSVVALDPPHVSAYGLTVEAGTPLADRPDNHPDDDRQAEMYEVADDLLATAGLLNYEVSNWARPGHESRHNRVYWNQGDYRGFGSAAHSHDRGRRWWNVRTPDRYVEAIETGRSPQSSEEVLDAETRRIEGLQLALRTRGGVPIEAFAPTDLELLDEMLEVVGERVVLTRRGRLMANEVSMRLR
ncbi:MAG: radical SAM family heme chaperone HemW [Actinomycetota bacterium]|jgi:putative oxygen-independent coproporphyrinogen III oxidase|nr:radical SAM family heme chaperone HemW [Actinomycetota bacterium]MDA3011440.1 radical SAM family heme chaperone HemW [Actinomycetota bacterium]MDA3025062.1 radical SAM family heme chaperone HemW [Actinomycetota bacterium]